MRKVIYFLVVVGLLTTGLIGCSNNSSAKAASKVRIATQPSVFASNILLAKVNGYLQEELKASGLENVDVTWNSFAAGPPMNEAFAAGALDIGLVGDVPLVLAKASGQKTVTFAKVSGGEKTMALAVHSASPISNISELKGKKVAFVKGSYGHHLLSLVLAKGGLTLDDIEQVNLPNADVGNAIALNQVDAGVIWEPGLTSAISTGNVRVFADGTDIKSNNIFFFVTESFAKNNPEILKAFIRAAERGSKDIAEDPKRAAALLKDEISLEQNLFAELLEKFVFTSHISDSDIAELKEVEVFNRTQRFSEAKVDIDKFVDRTFLREIGITK